MEQNLQFLQYARSAAFRIEMSDYMAMALWSVHEAHERFKQQKTYQSPGPRSAGRGGQYHETHFIPLANALIRRGLVEFEDISNDYSKQAWRITEAGILILKLCRIAGMVPDLTITEQDNKKANHASRRAGR